MGTKPACRRTGCLSLAALCFLLGVRFPGSVQAQVTSASVFLVCLLLSPLPPAYQQPAQQCWVGHHVCVADRGWCKTFGWAIEYVFPTEAGASWQAGRSSRGKHDLRGGTTAAGPT